MKKYERLICVLLLIATVVCLNIFVSSLTDRYQLRYDSTDSGIFQLSDATLQLLDTLDNKVTLYVIGSEKDTSNIINELLSRYSRRTDMLEIRYVDTQREPALIEQFYSMGYSVSQGSVVVECGENHRALSIYDLFTFNDDLSSVVSVDAEQQLSSAIAQVTGGISRSVVFTQGHNEQPDSALLGFFEQNGFTVGYGDGEDADMIVVYAPTSDFSLEETDMLARQLSRPDGALMVIWSSAAPSLNNLEAFLNEQGIAVSSFIAEDSSRCLSSGPSDVIAYYAQHEINNYFSQRQYYTVVPQGRVLELDGRGKSGRELSPVLYTSENASAAAADGSGAVLNAAAPYVLAASAEKALDSGESSRLFAAGSELMFQGDYISGGSYGNMDFFSQAASWCAGSAGLLNVPVKSVYAEPLVLTNAQSVIYFLMFCVVIPGGTLLCGVSVWRKRRNL